MALHVLASNMKRMMRILGVSGLMEAIRVLRPALGGRVQLVEAGDCCEGITEFLPNGRKRRPSRDDGDGEFDRFFACVQKADRDCNIEPPASPYAIDVLIPAGLESGTRPL